MPHPRWAFVCLDTTRRCMWGGVTYLPIMGTRISRDTARRCTDKGVYSLSPLPVIVRP